MALAFRGFGDGFLDGEIRSSRRNGLTPCIAFANASRSFSFITAASPFAWGHPV
jgi:hypothetical protein